MEDWLQVVSMHIKTLADKLAAQNCSSGGKEYMDLDSVLEKK